MEAGGRGSTAHAGPEGGRERSGGARRSDGKGNQQERRKVGSELVWAAGGRAGERRRCAGTGRRERRVAAGGRGSAVHVGRRTGGRGAAARGVSG